MTARWLLLATFALSLYSAGQVWLVQLSSYPLWAYVGRNEFSAYHRAWWRSIWGVVLGPAALVTLGLCCGGLRLKSRLGRFGRASDCRHVLSSARRFGGGR